MSHDTQVLSRMVMTPRQVGLWRLIVVCELLFFFRFAQSKTLVSKSRIYNALGIGSGQWRSYIDAIPLAALPCFDSVDSI